MHNKIALLLPIYFPTNAEQKECQCLMSLHKQDNCVCVCSGGGPQTNNNRTKPLFVTTWGYLREKLSSNFYNPGGLRVGNTKSSPVTQPRPFWQAQEQT